MRPWESRLDQQWRSARTLDGLAELTAQWLEGKLRTQPHHDGPPAPETWALAPVLAAANRAGYLTRASQPGHPLHTCACPCTKPEQRAAVEGFTGPATASRLWTVASDAGLWAIMHSPARLPRWRNCHHDAEPVTRSRTGLPITKFGTHLSRHHISSCCGWGACHRAAREALCGAWQVTLVDPEWGREPLLWDALAAALHLQV